MKVSFHMDYSRERATRTFPWSAGIPSRRRPRTPPRPGAVRHRRARPSSAGRSLPPRSPAPRLLRTLADPAVIAPHRW